MHANYTIIFRFRKSRKFQSGGRGWGHVRWYARIGGIFPFSEEKNPIVRRAAGIHRSRWLVPTVPSGAAAETIFYRFKGIYFVLVIILYLPKRRARQTSLYTFVVKIKKSSTRSTVT